jgi:hypothetical protein
MTTIAELEVTVRQQGRQLATLQSEIDELKANAAPPKVAVRQPLPAELEGVRIFHPTESAEIALPNEDGMQLLFDAVLVKYPKLRPYTPGDRYSYQDQTDFFAGFCKAFGFVARQGRTDEVDTKRSLDWWSGEASDWWRSQGNTGRIGAGHLLVAVIAAGDVGFVQGDEWGNQWSFSLATHGGRPATEAWRDVMRGQLRQPLPGVHKAPPAGLTVYSA